MAITTQPLTAEEAAACHIDGRWELVKGEVVIYVPVQPEHGAVVNEIGYRIRSFLQDPSEALMGPEIGFIVERDPDTVRAPDWSLTWIARANDMRRGAWIEGGPDLAVEVISADDTESEIAVKVKEYLRAGTSLVWIADPRSLTVRVRAPGNPDLVIGPDEVLSGGSLLPGFAVQVSELFPHWPER